MSHHKRKRPKHQRQGCSCKYWKDERGKNGPGKQRPSDRRRLQDEST